MQNSEQDGNKQESKEQLSASSVPNDDAFDLKTSANSTVDSSASSDDHDAPATFVENVSAGKHVTPAYKTPWFWLIVILLCIVLALAGTLASQWHAQNTRSGARNADSTELVPQQRRDAQDRRSYNTEIERERIEQFMNRERSEQADSHAPRDEQQAIKAAQLYANVLYLSQQGTYEQLVKIDNFSRDNADAAMKQLKVDWNKNAVRAAQSYKQWSDYTDDEIEQHLVTNDLYTKAQAKYAIAHMNDQPTDAIE
ncbi:prophage superinfection immunity protein [Bifidobacterium dolichotidis]|uniref:Prophage superinfection immunity protein n=1 Tax=Bifidobacterium dolichotidis TaxID=2306976 RepID=A0A430FPQ8_9BIFI|nr:Ltp family lipoprotein [Bifidobacterium dolichotidis]RSX54808.1 prophage superinfection immunity protein [Bifidobacterium dolichotidis]